MKSVKEKMEKNYIKKQKFKPLKKWLREHKQIIFRIILFPLWVYVYLNNKWINRKYDKIIWSEDICKKYLDICIPNLINYYKLDYNNILISNSIDMTDIRFNDFINCTNKVIKRKYNEFFNKFNKFTREYITNKYEIDGYKRMVLTNYSDWEKAKNKFDWDFLPCNVNYIKGVVFYNN